MTGPTPALPTVPPPLWVPFPDLKATTLWLAINQFRLRQKDAEQNWWGVFAGLQSWTWSWRLQLPQQLESLRMGDGNIDRWKYLDGPDWSDGTVRAPTWEEFVNIWQTIGRIECQQMLEAWGLRSLRGDTREAAHLQVADLKAAVFSKRLRLEASRYNLCQLLAQLTRELERERERGLRRAIQPPKPSRLIVEHGPATVTHQGALDVKIDAKVTALPSPAAAAEPGLAALSATPVLAAASALQDPQIRELKALVEELREKGLRASRTVWISAIESRFKLDSIRAAALYADWVPKVLLTGSGNKGGGEGDQRVGAWGKEPHKL